MSQPARLTLAACVGNRFDLATPATVSEQSAEAAWTDLAPAVAEGLIVPEGDDVFAFLHDRVQQAAYARVPEENRPHVHLTVGRLLMKERPGAQRENVFDIASHLNLGAQLIETAEEKLALARLNLAALRGVGSAATIVKAAHAITERIDLDDFMRQMLRIAIENAGAQRGLLLEERRVIHRRRERA